MKRALFTAALAAVSLAARADGVPLSAADYGLTPIDTLPDPAYLDTVFPDAVDALAALAKLPPNDPGSDLGVQLRAIRTLPTYCPVAAPCGVGTTPHDTLAQILDDYGLHGTPTPADVLRLRAAVEALGIAGRSAGLDADYLRIGQFLNHTSRDVRATTARALGTLCNTQANGILHTQLNNEPTAQVQLAISAALRALGPGQCH